MVENKKVMALNISNQMIKNNVNAADVCRALGIKQNTFSDWVNARTYPRIDKIEMMAMYFGCNKCDLVESNRPQELRKDEVELLKIYNTLNPAGIKEAHNILNMIASQEKYIKKDTLEGSNKVG